MALYKKSVLAKLILYQRRKSSIKTQALIIGNKRKDRISCCENAIHIIIINGNGAFQVWYSNLYWKCWCVTALKWRHFIWLNGLCKYFPKISCVYCVNMIVCDCVCSTQFSTVFPNYLLTLLLHFEAFILNLCHLYGICNIFWFAVFLHV